MGVLVLVLVSMFAMSIRQVNIKLNAFDAALMGAVDMKVIAVQAEPAQLVLQLVRIHPEVEEGADEHVTADTAKEIQVESFHRRGVHDRFSSKVAIGS